MKTLYLVRHGAAKNSTTELKDFDRVLSDKGIGQASSLGQWLVDNSISLDTILCSSAQRTKQTLQGIGMVRNLENTSIHFSDSLYLAGADLLVSTLEQLDNSVSSALVIGHNPGLSYLANELTHKNELHLSTGNLIGLEFACNDWDDIHTAAGKVIHMVTHSVTSSI